MSGTSSDMDETMSLTIERVKSKQQEILTWLHTYEISKELPLYSSVDIRDAGFKAAIVDTNLFPGGFNNLCEHGLEDAVKFFKEAFYKRVPNCQNILIIAEEHTRNTWYLENIRILEETIAKSGFNVKIATFLMVQPAFCETTKYVELETATKDSVKIFCLKRILAEFEAGREKIDIIILNNDLSTGVPDILKRSTIPIYPSTMAGWHARLKSNHFCHTKELIQEFARIISMDPWLFSAHFSVVDNVNINNEKDRVRLMQSSIEIFDKIKTKYAEHNIHEKPYVFVKSDSGTYGMGVVPIEDPQDILNLNRKNRNDLNKGKGAQTIDRFLIQEGVPTIYNIDQKISEVVIYQIENGFIGGFYRANPTKGSRENLNSPGMEIKKMCPHLKKYGEDEPHPDINIFDVYRILSRIAAIAASREMTALETGETGCFDKNSKKNNRDKWYRQ